jgi:hypothetical protein
MSIFPNTGVQLTATGAHIVNISWTIALRQALPRLRLRGGDRALLIWMTRVWLMAEKQILSLKPAPRLGQVGDEHSERVLNG